MRIAVIGAGAMGSIYGGHLSQHNDVLLVDTNEKVVEQVANNGLLIDEDGTYQPICFFLSERNLSGEDIHPLGAEKT